MIYSKKTDAVLPGQHLLHSNNNDDDTVDVMMMAWGGICAEDMICLLYTSNFILHGLPGDFIQGAEGFIHKKNFRVCGQSTGNTNPLLLTLSLIHIFFCMTVLKLPYALIISLIVGITNMIPYFGPFIGAIPGILILLIISPKSALIFAILILAIQQLDGSVIGPKILGKSTGLQPISIIFAITVGGALEMCIRDRGYCG